MHEESQRPDPDALLKLASEEQSPRGKLRIFFGFAPGVGKTYRMLQVARDLAAVHKQDVMVGIVETHRRADTAALVTGLPLLPRRNVDHRGATLEEFDLDAALARRPAVLLVDELAHTNAPGSRHPKRYQDVLELLDAGIDVLTTMNVQHVESLNDVVAQITGVQVRETVPDSVLERAAEIELIDLAPEELLARLQEGKVYVPEQAQRAMQSFFRRGNLLALRELALRTTAAHVDDDVRQYRAEHGVIATWPTAERLLVCVGPAPSSARLIRTTRRMAAGLRAPWTAAYVEKSGLAPMSEADRDRLEANLKLAESLGGTVTRLTGARVSDAVLAHARKHNVTRIVFGKPTHAWWLDRLRGSLLDDLVRGSGDIEIHVIAGDESEPRDEAARGREVVRARVESDVRDAPPPRLYVFAAALIALTTALAQLVHVLLPVPDLEMLYFVAIMIAATRLGRGPAIAAAALAVMAYDFFFVPPRFTFAVADGRFVLTFAMMFGVGFVLSALASRVRRQEQDATQREARTAALYALSRELGRASDLASVAGAVTRHASHALSCPAFVLAPNASGLIELAACEPQGASLDAKEIGVARWAFEHGQVAGLGTTSLPGAATVSMPMRMPTPEASSVLGVLVIHPARALRIEQSDLLTAFCHQGALAIEHVRLADDARGAELRRKTSELRGAMLSAVSHDLRTPLAAITGAATSLRDDTHLDPATRADLLQAVCDEADRLERLVANLLDMTRIESGAVALKREWVPLEELVGSALHRLDTALQGRDVLLALSAEIPLLHVDPVLLEQVLVNVIENAAKYTKPDAPIEVRAQAMPRGTAIEVLDRGPGIPEGAEERVFEKFYRGAHVGIRGVGLGLSICKSLVHAHGGEIRALRREGGGSVFRIELPSADHSPSAVPESPETREDPEA